MNEILAGPDRFFRPCLRHHTQPSYRDFLNSFAMKIRAGPYGSYDEFHFLIGNEHLGDWSPEKDYCW